MIILTIIAIPFFVMVLTGTIYLISKGRFFKWFYHNILEWHIPNAEERFDGCSFHSTCKICGKEIIRDSQGNWF